MRVSAIIITIGFFCSINCNAYERNIVDWLNCDSVGNVSVFVPQLLLERLRPENGNQLNGVPQKRTSSSVGYRIQVFSDNNPKTAKRDAQVKERNIKTRFPQLGTYVSYKAPSWKLRVGDFKTKDEAQEMLAELKKALPSYAQEMMIVVDRINDAR